MGFRTSFLLMLMIVIYPWSTLSDENVPCDYHMLDATALSNEAHVTAGKYTLYKTNSSWLDALLSCWARDADLAVPRSREDALALGHLLASAAATISDDAHMRDAVYIGLTDSTLEGVWWTVDGLPVREIGYSNWLGGRQELNESANCAALLADGHYIQQSCEAQLAYACEPRSTQAKRSHGYIDVAGFGAYKLHTKPLTWAEAGRKCEEEGATLAVPTSPRVAALLAGALIAASRNESVRQEGFFVGINDLASEGIWRSILGEKILDIYEFEKWMPGEPSGGRDENCIALLSDGRYADYPCSKGMAFCCELGGPRQKDEEPYITLGRYSLFKEQLTWMNAALACHRRNATLAVPRDQAEFDLLLRLLRDQTYSVHMGALYDKYGSLQIIAKGKKSVYGIQRDTNQGRCLHFNKYSYEFYKDDCTKRNPYVCEFPRT